MWAGREQGGVADGVLVVHHGVHSTSTTTK